MLGFVPMENTLLNQVLIHDYQILAIAKDEPILKSLAVLMESQLFSGDMLSRFPATNDH